MLDQIPILYQNINERKITPLKIGANIATLIECTLYTDNKQRPKFLVYEAKISPSKQVLSFPEQRA